MSDAMERLRAVREDVVAEGLDALVISDGGNRRWLTGFTGSSGWPVVTADDAFLLTDSRYFEQVEREAPAFRLERFTEKALDRLAELLLEHSVARAGVERDAMTLAQLESLRDAAETVEWVPVSGLVETHRAVKTEDEIDAIRRAAALTDEAMAFAAREGRPGMTERELAWALERFMRESGAEGMAFPIIVAAGENGSLPHHSPTDRPIGPGEPIVIDMGARVDAYNGDLTRTFAFGPVADQDYASVYDIVAEANRVATAGIAPGVLCRDVDALARDLIGEAGYGEYFGHGLGHGVGLDVHEAPRLGRSAGDDVLREGMVVTVEPGIYLPGRFGVRIEDLVVVRRDGPEVLSNAAKLPVVSRA